MSKLQIQRVTPKELQQLQEISIQTFEETFATSNSKADMQKYITQSLSLSKLKNEYDNPLSTFYFVSYETNIVGYLKLNTGHAQNEFKELDGIEIERIYVLNKFHGKGVGQLLLDFSINYASKNKHKFIWLGVWEKNNRALAFYTKNGFEIVGKHTFLLGSDEQIDLLMSKQISL